jgi:TP901 family phage tail tape measure protein
VSTTKPVGSSPITLPEDIGLQRGVILYKGRPIVGYARNGQPLYLIAGGSRTISVTLRAVIGQYRQGLAQASAQTKAFGATAMATAQQHKAAFTMIGGAAILAGGLIVRGLVNAGREAIEFEDKLLRLRTQIGLSEQEMRQMGDAALALRGTGVGALELADAAFFVASAGLRGAEALAVMESSAKAAAIGIGDTATIADLVTSAVNAYGSEVLSAAEATDVLVKTVREGKAPAAELAGAMGRVLPIASEMGVSFNEVGAAVAAMTRTGTDAATSTTQLRSILTSLLKPTQQTEEALRELGLSAEFLRDKIRQDGLWAALMELRGAIGENDAALGLIFPNVRALAGFLDLTGANAAANAEVFRSLNDVLGVTEEGFRIWANSAAGVSQRFNASMQAMRIEVGRRVEPVLTALRRTGLALTEMFLGLPAPIQTVVTLLAGLAGVSATAGGALLLLAPRLPMMIEGFKAMAPLIASASKSLIGFATNPAVLGFLALSAGALILVNHLRSMNDEIDRRLNQRMPQLFPTAEQARESSRRISEVLGDLRELDRALEKGEDVQRVISIDTEGARGMIRTLERDIRSVLQQPDERGLFDRVLGTDARRAQAQREFNRLIGLQEAFRMATEATRGSFDTEAIAIEKVRDARDRLGEAGRRLALGNAGLSNSHRELIAHHEEAIVAASRNGASLDELTEIILQLGTDPDRAIARLAELVKGMDISAESALKMGSAIETHLLEQLEELGLGVEDVTKRLKDNMPVWGEYEGAVEVSVDNILKSLELYITDMKAWAAVVSGLVGSVSTETLAALDAMPPGQKAALAQMAREAPDDFAKIISALDGGFAELTALGVDMAGNIRNAVLGLEEPASAFVTTMKAALKEVEQALGSGGARQAVREFIAEFTTGAETAGVSLGKVEEGLLQLARTTRSPEEAALALNSALDLVARKPIDLDTSQFDAKQRRVWEKINEYGAFEPIAKLLMDGGPAERKMAEIIASLAGIEQRDWRAIVDAREMRPGLFQWIIDTLDRAAANRTANINVRHHTTYTTDDRGRASSPGQRPGGYHTGGLVMHQGGPVMRYHDGGSILRAHNGLLAPDEVPAVLQRGEFVMRRSAVDQFGVDFMQFVNQGGGFGAPAPAPTTSGFSDTGIVGAIGALRGDVRSLGDRISDMEFAVDGRKLGQVTDKALKRRRMERV